MLEIQVPDGEYFDEDNNEFVQVPGGRLVLEHSLIALSKWESKWHKPFLNDDNKTQEEILDYVRCMTVNSNVDPSLYYMLSSENVEMINEYIRDPMTATTFSEHTPEGKGRRKKPQIITSEILYYDMIALGIPFECQKWHINRLQTLIRVCSIKSQPDKKMSKKARTNQQRSLNAARRAKYNSKG